MKYELVGRPPEANAADAVRRDFEVFLGDLESSPSKKVSVVFGWPWGNKIYEREWSALELTGSELRVRVKAAEARGLGRIGSDDLYVSLSDIGVERKYCHETDIHVVVDGSTHPYLKAQRQEWISSGWHVHEGQVAY